MKWQRVTIILVMILTSVVNGFTQGEYLSEADVLERQIDELRAQRNFIEESNFPQRQDVIDRYHHDLDRLIRLLDIATLIYETPSTVEADRIIEEQEGYYIYQSYNLRTNIKRFGKRTSFAGIVSDNSSIPVGTELVTEEFVFNDMNMEVLYRTGTDRNRLLTLFVEYKDSMEIFIDISSLPISSMKIEKIDEYGFKNERLFVVGDNNEVGKLAWINVAGEYELYPERYLVDIEGVSNQKKLKYRYAVRCVGDGGEYLTPSRVVEDYNILPEYYHTWYEGEIGTYPIKGMIKAKLLEGNYYPQELAYGYETSKELIYLQEMFEPQDGIHGYEKEGSREIAEWSMDFELGKKLTGTWLGSQDLPITLTPALIDFPDFTFKAKLTEELSTAGEVTDRLVQQISVYSHGLLVQKIDLEYTESLDYFQLGLADVNYDGYMDLIVSSTLYQYDPEKDRFDLGELIETNFMYLEDLYPFNVFNKSVVLSLGRQTIEYRVVDGMLRDYEISSYYFNEEEEVVYTVSRFENNEWTVIEESIERIDEESIDYEEDLMTSDNFILEYSPLVTENGYGYFTLNLFNKSGQALTIEEQALLTVELTDSDGNRHLNEVYRFEIGEIEETQMIDDCNIVNYDGNYYLVYAYQTKLLLPKNLDPGRYSFRIIIDHPIIGRIASNGSELVLPLPLRDIVNTRKLIGNINGKVQGEIHYYKQESGAITGAFINSDTNQIIHLEGKLVESTKILNLTEYEADDKLSGYFEGAIIDGIYTGFWFNTDRTIKVPFEFDYEY